MDRINLLDVAVFSAEPKIAQLLRQQGLEPEFLSTPGDELDDMGEHFIELTEEGGLSLRMASIRVAADVGIKLNVLVWNLDFALRPGCDQCTQCWDEDDMMCLLKRQPPLSPTPSDPYNSNTISLLDTAIMLGRANDARELVLCGVDTCQLNPDDLRHRTPCVFKCSSPACGAEWPVSIFAAPEQRQEAAAAAIRCFLRLQLSRLWGHQASSLLRILPRSRRVIATILAYSVDTPPMARLGVWHLVTGWDN